MPAGRPDWLLVALAIAAILTLPVAVLVFAPSSFSSQRSPAPRLTASVFAEKDAYLPGEPVTIAFTITNAGDGVAYVEFASTCMAFYSILAVDRSVVYDLRSHTGCGWMLTNLTLLPGDARLFRFVWNQISDSGSAVVTFRSYRIQAGLQSIEPTPGASAETRIFVMQGPAPPNLAFAAQMDRTVYGPGDSASVAVILTNIGTDPVAMHFGSPCFVQFLVLDETRKAVYNSSKWWGCIEVLTDEVLAPGQSHSWAFPWNLNTDAGDPLVAGQHYEVVPSFLWAYASEYQKYVSRTDVATFSVANFTV